MSYYASVGFIGDLPADKARTLKSIFLETIKGKSAPSEEKPQEQEILEFMSKLSLTKYCGSPCLIYYSDDHSCFSAEENLLQHLKEAFTKLHLGYWCVLAGDSPDHYEDENNNITLPHGFDSVFSIVHEVQMDATEIGAPLSSLYNQEKEE